jgi:4,5-dihydroxyphthalate decarboxylase
VQHFSGGEEEPGRVEKLKLDLPSHIRYAPIPEGKTISRMLADGELDAFVTARAPSTFYSEPDKVQRLFPDYVAREKDFYRRTKIFPIMHTVVIKREIYDADPWIAQALYKAFSRAKEIAMAGLRQTHVLASMLPWLVSHVEEAKRELGEDWWPYGLEANRHVLETFLRHHHEQGLSKRRFTPEEIFARETLLSFKV